MSMLNAVFSEIEKQFDDVFTSKKKYSLKYANILSHISGEEKRAVRVRSCATFWEYGHYSDDSVKFHGANFCKDVLCPQCAKRKSLKLFREVYECVEYLSKDYEFLFLTLTMKDVVADDLNEACDYLGKCYVNLMHRDRMKFVKGSFRSLEITHDNREFITNDMYFGNKKKHMKSKQHYYDRLGLKVGDKNPHFDYYHPHLHAILVVEKDYFKSADYLKQEELVSIWKDVLFVDYTPVCHITVCKAKEICHITSCKGKEKNQDGAVFVSGEKVASTSIASAVAEVAKYSVKGSDFLSGSNDEVNEKTVKTLLSCLKNRKMFLFYGVFREARALLRNTDSSLIDDNDLCFADDPDVVVPAALPAFGSAPVLVGRLFFHWHDSESRYISTYKEVIDINSLVGVVLHDVDLSEIVGDGDG